MSNDRVYLSDILDCIQKIEAYTVDGREAFFKTPMIQDAVIRNLEIMGEATKQVSLEVRQANADIRWQQIAGLRDILIHSYMKVNLERVWLIIEQDLPGLKLRLNEILDEINCI